MSRLLKTNGKVCILDVTADNWILKTVDKIARSIEREHVKFYSTKEYRQLFERVGLKCPAPPHTFNVLSKIHTGEK
jgi:hypothetical protein